MFHITYIYAHRDHYTSYYPAHIPYTRILYIIYLILIHYTLLLLLLYTITLYSYTTLMPYTTYSTHTYTSHYSYTTLLYIGVAEITWGSAKYPISRGLIEDGRQNLVLSGKPG